MDVSTMPEPTVEQMKEYWGYQKVLRICQGCRKERACWSWQGVAYKPEMLKKCSYEEIRDAINGIERLKSENPDTGFAIHGKWWAMADELFV